VAAAGLLVLAAPGAAQAVDTTTSGSGNNVIGIEYEDANFSGATLTRLSTNPGCTGPTSDVDSSISGMPHSWNDEISSFRGFGGGTGSWTICFAEHFQDVNFGGAVLPFSGSSSYVGDSFNDEATSIIWS
jgi:hypothetical protein